MPKSKNSIISTLAFAFSFLCGIITFGILFSAPARVIVESAPLSIIFLSASILNIAVYILAWIYLVRALRHKEPLKVIPIIISVFSLINLLYLYLSIGAIFELLSYS